MSTFISRGLAAGAVGTVMLDTVGYVDMLVTGREASTAPGRTVVALTQRAGLELPTDGGRLAAYGQLGGLAAGLGIGVVASAARRLGVRLPAPLAVAATALGAMAATDAPMAVSGVDDPTTWSAAAWTKDALPHLAYGIGVHWTLDRLTSSPTPTAQPVADTPDRRRVSGGLVARSAALGMAAGARASFGALIPALSGTTGWAAKVTAVLAGTELVGDKLPQTSSRLEASGQVSRLASGGLGAAVLARGESSSPWLPALAGMVGAAVGSIVGAAWREAAADRGWTWQAGIVEDVAALGLVSLAVRRGPG